MSSRVDAPVITAFTPEQFPAMRGAEIVMTGRSNVGKSSLLNQLLGKSPRSKDKKGARVSQTPGCTQSINFYAYTAKITLVDLPGYGYAEMPRAKQAQLKKLVEAYFASRPKLALLVHIVDARLELQPLDWQMYLWQKHFHYPYLLTLNKCDKLSRSSMARRKQDLELMVKSEGAGLRWIGVSAMNGAGISALRKIIQEATDAFFARPEAGLNKGESDVI